MGNAGCAIGLYALIVWINLSILVEGQQFDNSWICIWLNNRMYGESHHRAHPTDSLGYPSKFCTSWLLRFDTISILYFLPMFWTAKVGAQQQTNIFLTVSLVFCLTEYPFFLSQYFIPLYESHDIFFSDGLLSAPLLCFKFFFILSLLKKMRERETTCKKHFKIHFSTYLWRLLNVSVLYFWYKRFFAVYNLQYVIDTLHASISVLLK